MPRGPPRKVPPPTAAPLPPPPAPQPILPQQPSLQQGQFFLGNVPLYGSVTPAPLLPSPPYPVALAPPQQYPPPPPSLSAPPVQPLPPPPPSPVHPVQQQNYVCQPPQQQQQYAPAPAVPPATAPAQPPPPMQPNAPAAAGPAGPAGPAARQSESERILHVLETMKSHGFTLSDFILKVFESQDPLVKRRVTFFYQRGGATHLMELFLANKKLRESGCDEIVANRAAKIYQSEFEAGLVRGGINTDVRANSAEANGRTTGEILKDSLEAYDLAEIQKQCKMKAPSLWKLFETITGSGPKERKDSSAQEQQHLEEHAGEAEGEPSGEPAAKKRKTDAPTAGTTVLSYNAPLTVLMLLLVLASSQVRNKFQKWVGLYLYAQGVRKGPLNSLRTLGISVEGKVLGNNVLRVIGDDTKKKLRDELGNAGGMVPHVPGGATNRRNKRRSTGYANAIAPVPDPGPNPLDGKRQFVITQVTYFSSPKDHLRADNFLPCATIPFVIRLPQDTPVLTKSMIKTSSSFRRQMFSLAQTPAGLETPAPPMGGYNFNFSAPYNLGSGFDAPTPQSEFFYGTSTPGIAAPGWPGNNVPPTPHEPEQGIKALLGDDPGGQRFWRNRIRRGIWRAMKRLWPAVEGIIAEAEADEASPTPAGDANMASGTGLNDQSFNATPSEHINGLSEDDLLALPAMKRVDPKNSTEQMSILDTVAEYLGFDLDHLKGASNERIWLWAGDLNSVASIRAAKASAHPDSVLQSILPILQLFDIRQHFLLELLKQHYGVSNDKDAGSLCHHMHIMNRKFIIFGFSVTGFYAEGLMLNSMESHLITAILTATDFREHGPTTKEGILEVIDAVYNRYFEPPTPRPQSSDLRDDVFENHVVFIRQAIVYYTFLSAIATGDVAGLLRSLTWMSIAFQALSPSASSQTLANELMELVVGLNFEFAPPLAHAVLRSLLVQKPDYPSPVIATHPAAAQVSGEWQEVDFKMRGVLRQAKSMFDVRDNAKQEFFREVITPNIAMISKVVRNAEECLGTASKTANQWKSPAESVDPDKEIPRLVQVLREGRVAEWKQGRRANCVADDLGRKGVEKVLSSAWCEAFFKRGDGFGGEEPAETSEPAGEAGAPASGHVKGKRNLFYNEDFMFDWGV